MSEIKFSNEYTYRDTDVIPLSELSRLPVNPERIRIALDSQVRRAPIDIGAFVYSERMNHPCHSMDVRCLPVVESSLIPERKEVVLDLLALISEYTNHRTVRHICVCFSQIFAWCDDNKRRLVFVSEEESSKDFRDFSDHLHRKILLGDIRPAGAAVYQRAFIQILKIRFPDTYLSISRNTAIIKSQRRTLQAPSEIAVRAYVKCALSVARGLTRAVIDQNPFPWVFPFDEFEAVVFPAPGAIYTPFSGRKVFAYNVAERRVATVEEYLDARQSNRDFGLADVKRTIHTATANLTRSNNDSRSEWRVRSALVALRAYATLFLAVTGCSVTELAKLDYSEALEVEKSLVKKELSSIKLRARGKRTKYALGKDGGIQILREYIELRNWILDGKEYDRLFFRFSNDDGGSRDTVLPILDNVTVLFYHHVSGTYLDPSIPHLGSRLLRRHKSVALHSLGFSPRVVADVLNQTLAVNLSNYTGGTIDQNSKEMRVFWKSVRKAASVVVDPNSGTHASTAVGHCEEFSRPKSHSLSTEIQPDCKTQFGCFYCKNYLCHADAEDVHKLLSLQYVINAVRTANITEVHSEKLFSDLAVRIQYILKGIGDKSDFCFETVQRISRQVHDLGHLTPFWESRLQRYEQLGVVF